MTKEYYHGWFAVDLIHISELLHAKLFLFTELPDLSCIRPCEDENLSSCTGSDTNMVTPPFANSQ